MGGGGGGGIPRISIEFQKTHNGLACAPVHSPVVSGLREEWTGAQANNGQINNSLCFNRLWESFTKYIMLFCPFLYSLTPCDIWYYTPPPPSPISANHDLKFESI